MRALSTFVGPLLLGALGAGCTYPEFGFILPVADAEIDTSVEEVTVDSSALDTLTPIDVAGETTTDTRVAEVMPCSGGCSSSESCVAGVCRPFASCSALRTAAPSLASGVYALDPDGAGPKATFTSFCEMTEDGGGWTLAMKIDGTKKTFVYESALWTNGATLNPLATALDTTEAKLATFTAVPFTKLRVGMQVGTTRRFLVLDIVAASLEDLFKGTAVTTTAGRAQWGKLVADPLVQPFCSAEGINQDFIPVNSFSARARIGFLGNNENDCASPDSWIGFGAGFVSPHSCVGAEPGIVVGNYNPLSCGNSAGMERAATAFGYVFVR